MRECVCVIECVCLKEGVCKSVCVCARGRDRILRKIDRRESEKRAGL